MVGMLAFSTIENIKRGIDTMTVNLDEVDQQTRVRRSDYIADCLRDMIFNGSLKPGDKLPTEEKLCQHFSVSRTTLRESVQMLRVSGILDVTPGRGSYISVPDLSHLMDDIALFGRYGSLDNGDMAETRTLLESALIEGACAASTKDKKALELLILDKDGSAEKNEEIERAWHLAIADLSKNPMMRMFLETILNLLKSDRIKALSDLDEVMRTMSVQLRVGEAIIANQPEVAKRVMAGYLKQISGAVGKSRPKTAIQAA